MQTVQHPILGEFVYSLKEHRGHQAGEVVRVSLEDVRFPDGREMNNDERAQARDYLRELGILGVPERRPKDVYTEQMSDEDAMSYGEGARRELFGF